MPPAEPVTIATRPSNFPDLSLTEVTFPRSICERSPTGRVEQAARSTRGECPCATRSARRVRVAHLCLAIASSIRRPSSRARCAPGQKCAPQPKATRLLPERVMSNRASCQRRPSACPPEVNVVCTRLTVKAPHAPRVDRGIVMSMLSADEVAEVRRVLDVHAIQEVMLSYTRAIDRNDGEAMKSIFWPEGSTTTACTRGPRWASWSDRGRTGRASCRVTTCSRSVPCAVSGRQPGQGRDLLLVHRRVPW